LEELVRYQLFCRPLGRYVSPRLSPCADADDGKAQEQEAEAEAMDEEVTEDEARDADAKHSD
jgi:hypothetical protein